MKKFMIKGLIQMLYQITIKVSTTVVRDGQTIQITRVGATKEDGLEIQLTQTIKVGRLRGKDGRQTILTTPTHTELIDKIDKSSLFEEN